MGRPEIKIGNFTISDDSPCFVIAEIGHNHQGQLELAKKMIDAAAESGANAVKFQKRSNKDLFTKEAYDKPYENENSFGATYGEHREALEFGEKEYRELKEYVESKGLVFFATAFDIQSADFLERMGVQVYKVASACITDIPLIEHIAKKGKPMIISTGTSTIEDVDRAYNAVKKYGVPLCIMQCTAVYPLMDYREANLNVIKFYRERYPDALVGYSGHESGIVLPVVAYMLGARMVEKHFTINRAMKGTDQTFSLEPVGMRKLSRDLQRVHEALGDGNKRVQPSESEARKKLGKSVVSRVRIPQGTMITPEMLTFKSPGSGIPPHRAEELLGRVALKDIEEDKLVDENDLGKEQVKRFEKVDWGALHAK